MKVGYSHSVFVPIPAHIKAEVPLPTKIVLSCTDKHLLGLFAAKVREWRKPEPYKGMHPLLPLHYNHLHSHPRYRLLHPYPPQSPGKVLITLLGRSHLFILVKSLLSHSLICTRSLLYLTPPPCHLQLQLLRPHRLPERLSRNMSQNRDWNQILYTPSTMTFVCILHPLQRLLHRGH